MSPNIYRACIAGFAGTCVAMLLGYSIAPMLIAGGITVAVDSFLGIGMGRTDPFAGSGLPRVLRGGQDETSSHMGW